jgi:septal ring factor EnvC (AmiA/AmiB activator)
MQEKEVMTQPRTDTATLIKSCQLIWLHLQSDDEVASAALREIADRLEEQEAMIRKQRDAIKEFERYISEDAAEIATLRKTISEQAATIERLRSKAELFDQLTMIE